MRTFLEFGDVRAQRTLVGDPPAYRGGWLCGERALADERHELSKSERDDHVEENEDTIERCP